MHDVPSVLPHVPSVPKGDAQVGAHGNKADSGALEVCAQAGGPVGSAFQTQRLCWCFWLPSSNAMCFIDSRT